MTYEDASRKFSLFADKCIIRNKRQVSPIMNELNLPRGHKGLADDHYRYLMCLRKRPTRKRKRKTGTSKGQLGAGGWARGRQGRLGRRMISSTRSESGQSAAESSMGKFGKLAWDTIHLHRGGANKFPVLSLLRLMYRIS